MHIGKDNLKTQNVFHSVRGRRNEWNILHYTIVFFIAIIQSISINHISINVFYEVRAEKSLILTFLEWLELCHIIDNPKRPNQSLEWGPKIQYYYLFGIHYDKLITPVCPISIKLGT